MSEKVIIEVYSAKELDAKAKQRAYHEWLGSSPYAWGDENAKTLKAFESIFPIHVTHWEYDSCTSHVRFRFTNPDVEGLSGIRLLKYLYNNYYHVLFKGKYYYSKNGKNRQSKIIVSNDCVLTGYYIDEDILRPIYDFLKSPSKNKTFCDLMKECLESWGRACSEDLYYCSTMEYFEEEAELNEWKYLKDGRRL